MNSKYKDKVVIVTGASLGIGKATAMLFAEQGAKIVLASRQLPKLEEVAHAIVQKGGTALPIKMDISDRAQVEQLVQKTMTSYGRIDILINNAGYGLLGPLVDTPFKEIEQLFAINVHGCIHTIQAVYPHMRKVNGGQIINVSSIVGLRAIPSVAAYCMTKYAVNALSEALRLELHDDNIRVLTIYPGSTTSDFHHNQQIIGSAPKHPKWFVKTPEEVAQIILKASMSGKRDSVATLSARLMSWVHFFAPHLLDKIILQGYRKLGRNAKPETSELLNKVR